MDDSERSLLPALTPARLVTCVCAAQVCAQIGAYTWPALLPEFIARWNLTNQEAGWITGLFYAAYTLSVPILVTLTDRIDPRAVYLSGVALTIVSHWGFAAYADGFWTSAAMRALAGIGWAGTYMTGLKLLADRVDAALMSRAVAGHAASIGVAGSLSFVFAGALNGSVGWRGAFVASGIAARIGWGRGLLWGPPRGPPTTPPTSSPSICTGAGASWRARTPARGNRKTRASPHAVANADSGFIISSDSDGV